MTYGGLRSAVVVVVDEAAPAVDGWRERTCNDRPSIGVPPHVTLVFPFAPAADLDDAVERTLATATAATPAFEARFRTTARFPDVLYLAPEPAGPFVLLTEAIAGTFPDYPPYEGAFDTVVPHLTVAQGDDRLLAEAEADVARSLPIESFVREAVLLEEVEPHWGRWQVRARFPLGER